MSFLKNLKFKMDGQLKEAKVSSIFSLIYRIGILMVLCINVFPYNFRHCSFSNLILAELLTLTHIVYVPNIIHKKYSIYNSITQIVTNNCSIGKNDK